MRAIAISQNVKAKKKKKNNVHSQEEFDMCMSGELYTYIYLIIEIKLIFIVNE